jgi:MFS family permease
MMSHSSTDGRQVRARRRGYVLTAGVLLVMMLGGTLPIPLYVLYEKQMGFGPLGVTVVFVAYVLGTLLVLVALGDLSDHVGRQKVLALAVLGAVISSGLFLAASSIGLLIVARVVSGMAAGFATGTATAALAELQPRGDHQSARLPARRSVSAGVPLLLVCLGTVEAALFAKALWLFLVGTIAGGVAVGFIFRGGLSELNRIAAPRNRAAVVSAFFTAAYPGLGLPWS